MGVYGWVGVVWLGELISQSRDTIYECCRKSLRSRYVRDLVVFSVICHLAIRRTSLKAVPLCRAVYRTIILLCSALSSTLHYDAMRLYMRLYHVIPLYPAVYHAVVSCSVLLFANPCSGSFRYRVPLPHRVAFRVRISSPFGCTVPLYGIVHHTVVQQCHIPVSYTP